MSPKIIEILKNFGFPVLAAIALAIYFKQSQESAAEERKETSALHREERKEWLTEVVRQEEINRKTFSDQASLNRETNENLAKALRALEMTIERNKIHNR